MLVDFPDVFLSSELQKDSTNNVRAVGVEISLLPFKRHIAYATACCYRTSRVTNTNNKCHVYTEAQHSDFSTGKSYLTEHLYTKREELSRWRIKLCLLRHVRCDSVEQCRADADSGSTCRSVGSVLTQIDQSPTIALQQQLINDKLTASVAWSITSPVLAAESNTAPDHAQNRDDQPRPAEPVHCMLTTS